MRYNELMRTFIAIELEKEIRDTLFQIQEELKSVQADVKWIKTANIHLTLKFLGEVEEANKNSGNNSVPERAWRSNKTFYCQDKRYGGLP